ncbi:DUF2235 domain-containing protein [Apibacter sp. HY039]|uniref:phospholipase effector Tle1 domain-containing protein n=1 Tax=Apibacter sp. HY039 TaxID=2501476 RepID=UPI000FEBF6CC|nr:DUF2235 domain-containing protein [Apibacter sp. HY039]
MGKVLVYNSGKPEDTPGNLSLTYGLFFDGTLNNRENTKIWKKVRGVDGYGSPSKEEKEIYTTMAQKKKYWLFGKRVDIENNSYLNDFSNVARKSMSCKRDYTIYVEGIGTEVWEGDSTRGYAYGSGDTGIPEKVTKGCEELVKRVDDAIQKYKKNNPQLNSILLTLDIFGFSRGAAAARYCAYNLQKREYAAQIQPSRAGRTGIQAAYYKDHEGTRVDEQWLKNQKLPAMGNLGLALLKAGIDRELVEAVQVRVRFLGIYDTVASYDPDSLIFPSFREKIKKLHLDELGNPQKIVHLTSMDEHRTYFPLTRIKPGEKRIERNFPGVHSDIGGSYTNYIDTGSEKRLIEEGGPLRYKKIEAYYHQLIRTGWYTESQLKLGKYGYAKRPYMKIIGERNLRKEYSYIFLHFMRDESQIYIGNAYIPGEIDKYSLDGNEFLQTIKERLQIYTLEENEDWVLRKERSSLNPQALTGNTGSESPPERETDLDTICVQDWDRKLKKLRNEYLHWSSYWGKLGYEPNTNRKRQFYNADGTLG